MLSPEQKASWEQQALQNRMKAAYHLPTGHYQQQMTINQSSETIPVPRKRGRPRKNKDKNAPKRCRTAFVLYASDERPKITTEISGISFVDMGTILGKRWKALSAEEKKAWEVKAAEDKIRYLSQMVEYKAQQQKIVVVDATQERPAKKERLQAMTQVASSAPIATFMQFQQPPALPYTAHAPFASTNGLNMQQHFCFPSQMSSSVNAVEATLSHYDAGSFYPHGWQFDEQSFGV